jgi:aspartate/methionine/tyrosine aminotransferase
LSIYAFRYNNQKIKTLKHFKEGGHDPAMNLKPFKLERYFSQYEFSVPYLMCASDCEPLAQQELLDMADDETRKLWETLTLAYTETAGHPLLRQAIAGLYEKIEPEHVLVVAPEEGIFIALQALLSKGDHVVATWPGYQSLHEIPRNLGCVISFWKPEKKHFPFFSVARLKTLLRKNTRILIINFPHNPTGAVLEKKEFDELVQLARERKIAVFSDEMYRFLEYDVADRQPGLCDILPKAIILGGLSKAFGLPGLRIGWLATQDHKLYLKMAAWRDYTTICNSAPSEILALIALRNREQIIERHRKTVLANLELLDRFFEQHQDLFDWYRPRAGSIALPALKGRQGNAARFCQTLVEKQGVLLVPGNIFNCASNRFRIGFGRRNLPQALEQLENYLKKQFRL